MVQDGGGGKLPNPVQFLVVDIVICVIAAAGEKGVLNACGQEIAVTHFQIEIVQPFEKAAGGIIRQIAQMVPVNLPDGGSGGVHEPLYRVAALRCAVTTFQRGEDRAVVFFPERPQVGNLCAPDGPGVRHVKNIFQMGPAAVLPNQGDPLGAGTDPPVHGPVPKLHTGAGGGVGTLGVNQELVVKGILV